MAKNYIKVSANVVDTVRPEIAGAKDRPGLHVLRRIAERITTPLLPDDYLKLANPLWSARELRGRVVEVRRETEDSATLVIKPGWGFSFDYRPGQYVGIGVLVDGRWRWRSYSLTSSPVQSSGDHTITITVKAMPEGFLSTHLVGGVAPGTIVRLAAPQGEFVMPDPAPSKVLFLTAGSGITPVMSMLRTLARRGQLGDIDVVHIHSAPTESDVIFADELNRMADDYPGYRLRLRATRTEGRLDLGSLDNEVADWREREAWACGPEAMLAETQRVFTAAAVRLHLERFAASRAAVSGAGGTVTFERSGKAVTADAATSLMEAGEQAGVRMPFGCRMGICQSCVVALVDGHVRDLRTGEEREPGTRVQTCISAAAGDCVLDI
ncbi:ferredoxin reductase [Mycobacterium sp. OTB74]|uniref:ferredoxin reductase n=1 Tax=Mycobacterium sp. OTB74 TaxID=1853452 RepID=UPI002473B966|nr:ferredoxin reductase [Mycobacterium sp. OTB74]MDH6242470.1 ferredoxin-NADP reductase [Mycobacterium sp. OTB74]